MPLVDLSNAEEIAKYADFVRNSKYGRLTQDPAWSDVKANWTPHFVYLQDDDGEICAAMSILTIPAIEGKNFGYCSRGPVADVKDIDLLQRLFAHAKELLAAENVFLLRADPEVIYSDELNEKLKKAGFAMRNRGINPHSTSQPRVNMRIDLEGMSEESLLEFFQAKTRYNIRLAKRKGVSVRWSNDIADVEKFFETYRIMSERHGITHRPLSYFKGLADALGDNLRIYLASFEDEILSAAICVNYGDITWYMYGGSTNSQRNKMPNYLMQWEMIQWALEKKSKYYDFGGVYELSDEDGLFRFKRGFVGAENISEYIGEIDYVLDQDVYEKFLNR